MVEKEQTMSKYYKSEDVILKRAEDLADTSYWEYGNPKNVDEWIEVAESEFKDLPTIEVSEDNEPTFEQVKDYCFKRDFAIVSRAVLYDEIINLTSDIAPSVVPSRAEGEWLLDGRCSECLERPLTTHKNYCPNCGAKMKG